MPPTPFAGATAGGYGRPVDRVVIDHQIMQHYPQLTRQDILGCLRYAAHALHHRSAPLTSTDFMDRV